MDIKEKKSALYAEFARLHKKLGRLNNQYILRPEDIKKDLPSTKLKLTDSQLQIMNVLCVHDHALTVGEVAKFRPYALYKQLITQSVAGLVKLGIVRRFQKENNLRSVYIELTDYGLDIQIQEQNMLENYMINKLFSVATIDEVQQLVDCYRYCTTIIQRLSGNNIMDN